MTLAKAPPNRRPYHRHGRGVVDRALPYLLERIKDVVIPEEDLSPVERAAREWRWEVLTDLGGLDNVSAARMALLDAATGTKIILDSLDMYVFELAGISGLVNRRNRKVATVVTDRMRVADSLARQLHTLGLERRRQQEPSLNEYVQKNYSESKRPGGKEKENPNGH